MLMQISALIQSEILGGIQLLSTRQLLIWMSSYRRAVVNFRVNTSRCKCKPMCVCILVKGVKLEPL